MCDGGSWEAGIDAVVEEEDNFGLVEARPAVGEVNSIERLLADRAVLRMVEVRIVAGLHDCIRPLPTEEYIIQTEAILSWWSYTLSAVNKSLGSRKTYEDNVQT
jgi:hypothetical protein